MLAKNVPKCEKTEVYCKINLLRKKITQKKDTKNALLIHNLLVWVSP